MEIARISALLDPFLDQPLANPQLEQISIYIDLLLRWNARINLTAIRQEEDVVTRHFGESFFMARHLFPGGKTTHVARTLLSANADDSQLPGAPLIASSAMSGPPSHPLRVLDIGSGAGFPGFPLKLWAPNIELTLIESNHKKAAFLREVARALILTDVNVMTDRAEALAANPDFPRADIVTLRAVERFQLILPHALKLMAPHARLALLVSTTQTPYLYSLPNLEWGLTAAVPQSHAKVLTVAARY